MNKLSKCVLLLAALCSSRWGLAQKAADLEYTPAESLTLAGKIQPTDTIFRRANYRQGEGLPPYTRQLLTYGAGMAVAFRTNSTVIGARWCVSASKAATNLNPINNKGLDLYIKRDGRWLFAGVGRPTGTCSEAVIVKDMEPGEKECLLYLPTYDETRSLEVGVGKGTTITALADPFRKRVLIYGSSIAQGAAASRPGMAYPARLSRNTGISFLNLGLSGSAKMEKEAADLVASINADAYVLDCVPNSSPAQVRERTQYLVETIRAQHPSAPIIVVQSIFREMGNFDQKVRRTVEEQNAAITGEVAALRKKGMKDLYFITSEAMMGDDHEGSVDGIHPSDLGFDRMLRVLEPQLTAILAKYGITAPAGKTAQRK